MFSVGMKETLDVKITDELVKSFSLLVGDTNPVHLSEEYAQNTRFKRRIAHGMLVASFISTVLGTKLPGNGGIYLKQNLSFLKPVYLDDVIEVVVEVTSWDEDKKRMELQTNIYKGSDELAVAGSALMLVQDK